MPPWRFLLHGPASPAWNMAVDEALLREVREPVLRIYEWSVPAVSLGYFQPAALAANRPFIRRYTGGGLVDHAHDITYTIVLPREHPIMELSMPASYQNFHVGVQAVLRVCGLISELTPEAAVMESDACFQKPVRYDIVADGQKLSGAAQRRTREGMLHQGSILLPDPSLNQLVRENFASTFGATLGLTYSTSPASGELTSAESARATDLERDRYSTEAWNKTR